MQPTNPRSPDSKITPPLTPTPTASPASTTNTAAQSALTQGASNTETPDLKSRISLPPADSSTSDATPAASTAAQLEGIIPLPHELLYLTAEFDESDRIIQSDTKLAQVVAQSILKKLVEALKDHSKKFNTKRFNSEIRKFEEALKSLTLIKDTQPADMQPSAATAAAATVDPHKTPTPTTVPQRTTWETISNAVRATISRLKGKQPADMQLSYEAISKAFMERIKNKPAWEIIHDTFDPVRKDLSQLSRLQVKEALVIIKREEVETYNAQLLKAIHLQAPQSDIDAIKEDLESNLMVLELADTSYEDRERIIQIRKSFDLPDGNVEKMQAYSTQLMEADTAQLVKAYIAQLVAPSSKIDAIKKDLKSHLESHLTELELASTNHQAMELSSRIKKIIDLLNLPAGEVSKLQAYIAQFSAATPSEIEAIKKNLASNLMMFELAANTLESVNTINQTSQEIKKIRGYFNLPVGGSELYKQWKNLLDGSNLELTPDLGWNIHPKLYIDLLQVLTDKQIQDYLASIRRNQNLDWRAQLDELKEEKWWQ